jgi:hypothetical protein
MEIKLGNITLRGEPCGHSITYILIVKDGVVIDKIDSKQLQVAIKALEEGIWRP